MSVPSHIPNYKRTLLTFPVLWAGWECDDEGWVVELKDGSRALVMSSHCHESIVEPGRLQEKIAEYEEAAHASKKALALLGL
jgi:hypothetical protein